MRNYLNEEIYAWRVPVASFEHVAYGSAEVLCPKGIDWTEAERLDVDPAVMTEMPMTPSEDGRTTILIASLREAAMLRTATIQQRKRSLLKKLMDWLNP